MSCRALKSGLRPATTAHASHEPYRHDRRYREIRGPFGPERNCDDLIGAKRLVYARHGVPPRVPRGRHGNLLRTHYPRPHASPVFLSVQGKDRKRVPFREFAIRIAARTVIAAILLSLAVQIAPLSDVNRQDIGLTGSLCGQGPASTQFVPSARERRR